MKIDVYEVDEADEPTYLGAVLLETLPPIGAALLFVADDGRAASWTVEAIQISPVMAGSPAALAYDRGERVQLGRFDLLVTRDEAE